MRVHNLLVFFLIFNNPLFDSIRRTYRKFSKSRKRDKPPNKMYSKQIVICGALCFEYIFSYLIASNLPLSYCLFTDFKKLTIYVFSSFFFLIEFLHKSYHILWWCKLYGRMWQNLDD